VRDDFCAFILTHGRPGRVITYDTLLKAGYTGKIYIVIDDEDKTADEYRRKFDDKVLMFSKVEIAKTFDEGDNFDNRKTIIYARNACFDLARQVGCRYFIQLDDDYDSFRYRLDSDSQYKSTPVVSTLDGIFESLVEFHENTGILSVALSQGGDHMGGGMSTNNRTIQLKRKAMNTFICSTDRPFQFFGRINEDVNIYTTLSRMGGVFFTVMQAMVNQLPTQSNAGGMTDVYLECGTYLKSFYSVMYCPSSVRVGEMKDQRSSHGRLHHVINWDATAVRILHERHRKA
jgi:hypothetical protein